MDDLRAQILGGANTPYEKGVFKLEVIIPERYPFEPPQIRFLTPIYQSIIQTLTLLEGFVYMFSNCHQKVPGDHPSTLPLFSCSCQNPTLMTHSWPTYPSNLNIISQSSSRMPGSGQRSMQERNRRLMRTRCLIISQRLVTQKHTIRHRKGKPGNWEAQKRNYALMVRGLPWSILVNISFARMV
ncbi:Ubiquitin-conjugating enzyme E2 T [Manis javanica]|nr:Ubiquitin-conjugating enzyme E2 T [Manis javanica]